jgi:hypothetical protein
MGKLPPCDLVAGYVTGYDPDRRVLDVRTTDGHPRRIMIAGATAAECLRNLGEPYLDAAPDLPARLVPGRHLFARGVLQPDAGILRAGQIILTGLAARDFSFEKPGWWACQLRAMAPSHRQPGPGLVYAMATAYLLTSDGDYLDIAERGAGSMRERTRFEGREGDLVYWHPEAGADEGGEARRGPPPRSPAATRRSPCRSRSTPWRASPSSTGLPGTRGSLPTSTRHCGSSSGSSGTASMAATSRTWTGGACRRTRNRCAPTVPARAGTRSAGTPPPT